MGPSIEVTKAWYALEECAACVYKWSWYDRRTITYWTVARHHPHTSTRLILLWMRYSLRHAFYKSPKDLMIFTLLWQVKDSGKGRSRAVPGAAEWETFTTESSMCAKTQRQEGRAAQAPLNRTGNLHTEQDEKWKWNYNGRRESCRAPWY